MLTMLHMSIGFLITETDDSFFLEVFPLSQPFIDGMSRQEAIYKLVKDQIALN